MNNDPAPHNPCIDGGDHLEHVWPVELFKHTPDANCICEPEFLCDEHGFYFLHFYVTPEDDGVTQRV